jgi:hypothetical protein
LDASVLRWRHEKQRPSPVDSGRVPKREQQGERVMSDAFFLGLPVAFFAVCAAYAHFCDKVR